MKVLATCPRTGLQLLATETEEEEYQSTLRFNGSPIAMSGPVQKARAQAAIHPSEGPPQSPEE